MASDAEHTRERAPVLAVGRSPRRRHQWTGLLREPGTALGLFLVASLLIVGLVAPWLPLDDPTDINLPDRLHPPSAEYLLGTDHLGRDTFSRIVHGARMTLVAAAATLALSMTIALAVGILSGYNGGWTDTALMGVVDLLLAFPSLILALAVAGALGPGLFNVLLAAGAVWWVGHARIIRGITLGARQTEYVIAARAVGAGNMRIIFRHIAPSILGPIIVIASLDVGWIILGIAGLNFLGLGAQPPTPEWGAMLNDARQHLQTAPRLLLLPGAAIFLAVLGFNLLGDGLRDLLDPRTRRPGN
ncbi:MAG: ABC transporter permease subunit [Chloroflexota bacterium]|nr:ABC transporter permease subunit [Chloroflexota bacterium]